MGNQLIRFDPKTITSLPPDLFKGRGDITYVRIIVWRDFCEAREVYDIVELPMKSLNRYFRKAWRENWEDAGVDDCLIEDVSKSYS